MSSLAILTPSYGPDLELCRDLNRSVLRWTPPDVHHHVLVPRRDRELFAPLRGPRTEVWTLDRLIPRRMLPVPAANLWLNVRRPHVPIRGWVMQQLVQLSAGAELGADLLLLVDSDVVFVRPVTVDTFREAGRVRFYRSDDAIDERLPRHLIWHDVARRLLGLPPAGSPPLPDYVSSPQAWDRRVVLALRDRVEEVTGRPWLDAIASQLHFSECILHGVFVDEVLGESANVFAAASMLCHNYYDETPLAAPAAASFVRALPPEDVAVMISAKSGTSLKARRDALSRVTGEPIVASRAAT
jgi:Family of unknown function (DUF6492)